MCEERSYTFAEVFRRPLVGVGCDGVFDLLVDLIA
jgi:hypothetical protein